ncbi:isochorismate synthase [Candidatus Poriferisodalis sp.]|uniref:isochorismate synthase n=1 Tax=Candidatus Poriferisodalis sp. TaxID=3101277 RepID=UPI003B02EA73
MRVEELASAHSVSVDTVRYYQKIGLLHPPTRQGRVAAYDESHDRRLGEIRRMAEAGFSLAQIGRLGDGTDEPMLVALGARRDDTLTFDELVQQSGLDAELVRLATDTGLVRPLRNALRSSDDESVLHSSDDESVLRSSDDESAKPASGGTDALYSTGALTMLRAATELLAAEMPLDDLVGLALRHASNMEAVAADAVELFADRFADRPVAERAELAARLIPLVTDLVAQHFRESLVERATERILSGDIADVTAGASNPPGTSAGLRARQALTLDCRELSGELDPLAVFAASDTHQRVYWACPGDDLEFCALGSVFEAGAEAGADRFASVAEAMSYLDVTVSGASGDPTGPLLVGGFAFSDEQSPAGSAWEAFGRGRLTLPEVLLVRRGGTAWLTAVPGADVSPIMAAARSGVESVCATCGVADGSGVCGLEAEPNGEAGARAAREPVSNWNCEHEREATGDAAGRCTDPRTRAVPAACVDDDPELAEGPARDLNAAALAALGGSHQVDDDYTKLVRRALERIAEGGLDKVVTARELHIASGLEPIAVLNRLRSRYPSCVTFAFGRGPHTFFGATPEQLVNCDGLRLQTDALAGSGRRVGDPARDRELAAELQRDPKELTEHAMVVTDVRDTLRACGAALDAPSPTGVMELRRIRHLHTPISGRVPTGTTVLELAAALHPTAAVAGLPRRVAREWISCHEDFERGWYAAPVGWTTLDGRGEFRVALRCALTGPGETRLFAGGGIVEGAVPDAELAETNIKLEALLHALEDD